MQSRVYKLTPNEVATIRSKLPGVTGDQGTFNPPSHPEVTLGFSLAGQSSDGRQWLTLTVLHDAWYETCGEIWNAVDALMPPDAVPAS